MSAHSNSMLDFPFLFVLLLVMAVLPFNFAAVRWIRRPWVLAGLGTALPLIILREPSFWIKREFVSLIMGIFFGAMWVHAAYLFAGQRAEARGKRRDGAAGREGE